jgi:hypothetical protein
MLPAKAILKQDVFSYIKAKHQYAKKHDVVTVVDLRDHVAVVVKENGDWFATHIEKLKIIS